MNKLLALLDKLPIIKLLAPLYIGVAIVLVILIRNGNLQLLDPAGFIARIQSQILWGALIFAALVGGFIVASFFIVTLRYKEEKKRRYEPDWTAGKLLQLVGWGIPLLAITIISVMVWITAHQVDPYSPINSSKTPITIQVVAERWKWLFIYPDEHIATVNMMEIPVGVPITLHLTADAPMNSFWVPRLSGQMYAMSGMVTQLHIRADKSGAYAGSSAEISGDGFAGMNFTVNAVSDQQYATWKTMAQRATKNLDYASYTTFARPSSYDPVATYRLADQNLFDEIVMQFMAPSGNSQTTQGAPAE